MSKYTQTIELKYSAISDNCLPELSDPSEQFSREELKEMSYEVSEFIENKMAHTGNRSIVCQNQPEGLPSTWKVLDDKAPPGQRGYFKILRPVYEKCETQLEDKGLYEPYVPEAHSAGPETVRGDNVDASSKEPLPAEKTSDSTCSSESCMEFLDESETRDWPSDFLQEIAKFITESECISRSSDRAVQTEILEEVIHESEKHPNQFAIILYQSLIRALYQAAKKEHRRLDEVRFELGLSGLEQIHKHLARTDKNRSIPTERVKDQVEDQVISWLPRWFSACFS